MAGESGRVRTLRDEFGLNGMISPYFDRSQISFAIKRFFIIWLLLTLLLAAVVWTFYGVQKKSAQGALKAAQRDVVRFASQLGAAELSTVRSDLLYLADQSSTQHWIATDGQLASQYFAFASRKKIYDQIRFIDDSGREVVRVDWKNGQPAIVNAPNLQDKSGRYYVRRTLSLGNGEIYVSPFDLNVEHGVVEQPTKPMIRFCTPVFDQQGRKRGIIALNYQGRRLLDRLRQSSGSDSAGHAAHVWLLNAAGYWLLGPQPENEWGFMYPDRKGMRFENTDAQAWKMIKAGGQEGQFETDQGLYTYSGMVPLASQQQGKAPAIITDESWILVAHVPAEALGVQGTGRWGPWVIFGVAALILGPSTWGIAYYSTRRRFAEETVRASEARFRALVESAPDALVIINRDGRITLANALAEQYFGYTREELEGQTVELLVPERLRGQHQHHRANYVADPYTRAMGEGLELHGRRKDGSEFPIEISLSPLETPQGTLVTAIIRDITSRKQAERLRMEAQERYRSLVNNLPVGVYRKTPGPEGKFVEVNPALLAILEAESSEALLNHPVSAFHRDPSNWAVFSERLIEQGIAVNDEIEMVTLKGHIFWGAITGVVKREGNGQIFFDGTIVDITQRKEMEGKLQRRTNELEAMNRELEAFSYSVSHDLRAPLRAIDGFSRILLSTYADSLDETGRDRLERVRSAAQKMGTLIDDLLKLSRVTRTELKREEVDLSALATEIGEELHKQTTHGTVHFTVAPGLKANGDLGLLRIALENLLNNAWKFSSGRRDAEVSFGATVHKDKPAYAVSDNGSGFDMAYADKLFGAFQRLHDAKEFPGTGIGLATVQRIIHKHGGEIFAESAPNEGAKFYFTLGPEGQL